MQRAVEACVAAAVRANLLTADYSAAEQCCPQRMPIGDLVRQTAKALA